MIDFQFLKKIGNIYLENLQSHAIKDAECVSRKGKPCLRDINIIAHDLQRFDI